MCPKIGSVDRRSTGASKAPDTRELRDMSPELSKAKTEGSLALNGRDAEVRDLINQMAYSRSISTAPTVSQPQLIGRPSARKKHKKNGVGGASRAKKNHKYTKMREDASGDGGDGDELVLITAKSNSRSARKAHSKGGADKDIDKERTPSTTTRNPSAPHDAD